MREITEKQGKFPPNSIEAERAVIGSVLLDNKSFYEASMIIKTDDFYSGAHRIIWKYLTELVSGDQVNLVNLIDILETKKKLEGVGGRAYILALAEGMPTAAHVKHYAKLIKDKSILRAIACLGDELYDMAISGERKAKEVIIEAENKIFALSLCGQGYEITDDVAGPKEIASRLFERIELAKRGGSTKKIINTGFSSFDYETGGLQDLTIISASTGIGKTGLALNWAVNIGITQKIPCLYINLEMAEEALSRRILGISANIKVDDIRDGKCDGYPSYVGGLDGINSSKLFITDNYPKDINIILSLINYHKALYGIEVVFIDYLGEIIPIKKDIREKEYIMYGEWVQTLKGICTKLDIRLVVLAQLNRSGETAPRRENIAGSWKIIQKADTFCILYNTRGAIPILKIAKQRHGQYPLSFELDYQKTTQRMEEICYFEKGR